MTDRRQEPNDPAQPRAPLSTRATPPRPRRLSRKAIALLSGVGAFAVAGALAYSLSGSSGGRGPQETVSVEHRQAEPLSGAPRDYGELAARAAEGMGPPAPIMPDSEPAFDGTESGAAPSTTEADQAEERRRQQAESARGSRLFAGAGEGRGPSQGANAAHTEPAPALPAERASGTGAPPDRRAAFVVGGAPEPTTNSGRLTPPPGSHVVTAGSTIAAALITGLSSDLPGQVVAQVTEDVFDSVTGRTKLIPQGTRLLGVYDSNVSTGQSRALVVWTRMILPDGRSIDLDRLIGTDAAGQSGFADRVNNHWGTILRAGLLSTLLGVGTQASGFGENDAIADAIRDSAGQTVGRAGDRIVERQLGIQPTITVRPGARVRVLVSRDLVLSAWPEG